MQMILRLCLLGALLAGCSARTKPPADTLVVGIEAQPATLDPRFATDALGMRIDGLIFQGLVHVNDHFQAEGEAAAHWTVKNHTYTFVLKPGLKFHNGRAVEASDLLYSFDVYRGGKSPFASQLAVIRAVRAHADGDHLLVEIDVDNLSEKFLNADLSIVKILPKPELEKLGNAFAQKPMGSGPYRFAKLDLNEIRLEAVDARVPHLVFKVIRDDFTRYQKLLKGEVDLVPNAIPLERVKDFEARPQEFQVFRYAGLAMAYILINFKDPRLKQIEVRRALDLTLERDEILRFKMSGLAREATSLLTPNNPYFNHDLKNPKPDIGASRALIEKLGLTGTRLTLKTSNTPQAIDNGKVLANQLSRSGLVVELQSYEWGTFYSDVKKGNFQLASMRWVGTIDPSLYTLVFHSHEVPPGRNRGSYLNPELDHLLDRATNEENPKLRHQLFWKVQAMVHNDYAILPLWYDDQVVIARKNVLNFHPSLQSDYRNLAVVEKREN
jgi:peptide/nickel transport system substrate-binding protein